MVQNDIVRRCLEEMLDSNASAEDVCADHPDILPEVRRRWSDLLATRASMEAMFPHGGPRSADSLPDTPPALPGYGPLELIGHGGMGIVFKARHLALDRIVAIKMLLPGTFALPSEADSILREASAVASLRHPNIVQVHDVGVFEHRPYFTMEHLEGGSLASRTAGTPQPAREAASLTELLARAMHEAHRAGVVHRDLKPGNILFTGAGSPKIVDFGLARRIDIDPAVSFIDRLAGTPSYMAPEQAQGKASRCAPPVDIYALGAILYELLSGRPPFRASTAIETHRQVLETEPAPPSSLNVDVPRELETICLKCLRKQPEHRYESALALAEDLHRYLEGRPILARRTGPIERTVKLIVRKPAHAALVALVSLAIGVVAVGATWVGARRAGVRAAVEADITQAMNSLEAGRLGESRHFIALASSKIANDAPAGAEQKINDASAWLTLAETLDKVRMDRAASPQVHFDRAAFGRKYEDLLRNAGMIASFEEPLEVIAARIRACPIRTTIVEALNDWAYCSTDKGDLQRRLTLARLVDPDPIWRDKVRNVHLWKDKNTLVALVASVPDDPQVVSLSPILAGVLRDNALDALEFLREVQASHPSDFWANFQLAEHLDAEEDSDAIGFYRAAHALRPDSAAALVNLGRALYREGADDEARACWTRAAALEPPCAPALVNLAIEAAAVEQNEEAERLAMSAHRADPTWAYPLLIQAELFSKRNAFKEAAGAAEQAQALLRRGDPSIEEARAAVEQYRHFAMLDTHLAEFVEGSQKPQSADDAFAIAQMLLARDQPRAAVAFAALGLSLGASNANAPTSGRRYLAACAAISAAQDSSMPSNERIEMYARAIDWLRSDLDALNTAATTHEGRLARRRTFERWIVAPGLAPLREVKDLEGSPSALPSEISRDIREFWTAINDSLNQPL